MTARVTAFLRPAGTALCALAVCAMLPQAGLAQSGGPGPAESAGATNQPPPPGQVFSDPTQIFNQGPGAFFGLGVGRIDEDWYLSTLINFDLSLGPVGLGLAVPMNLLLANTGPGTRDEKTYFGVVRRRDWNEPVDYFKFVRYVRYGHKRDPLYVLAGQLWGASIGHGSLVNRYSNSLNLDRPKFGLAFDVNTTYFGFETLTDSVESVIPSDSMSKLTGLLAARAYIRPFGDTPFLRGWAIGATIAADRNAPLALARCSDPVTGPPPATCQGATDDRLVLDENKNPIVAASQTFYGVGVDTEYELLNNSIIQLIPYVDLNRLVGAGNGLHAGAMANIYLPVPVLDISVQTKLEWRWMKPGYIPEYFDQQYDLGRLQYRMPAPIGTTGPTAGADALLTKAEVARRSRNPDGHPIKGYYGELSFNFGGILQIGGLYQDYETDNGASMGLFATLPKLELVKVSGYYLRKNFNGFSEALKLDERSLLGASVAYRMFGPIYLRVDFTRQWTVPVNDAGQPGAQIEAVDSFKVGIASFLPF